MEVFQRQMLSKQTNFGSTNFHVNSADVQVTRTNMKTSRAEQKHEAGEYKQTPTLSEMTSSGFVL